MRFSLKQLEYFVAAAESGSIKLASERINISQPSISAAVSHLEKELAMQLFVRHHARGLSLTPGGRRMLREAKLVLRGAEGLYSVAEELSSEIRGPLSVGCMVTLAPMILPELGHAFTRQHPDVRLSISEGDHEQLLSGLRQIDIDVAISYDLQIPEELDFEPLVTLPPQVLVAREHPFSSRQSLTLGDLEDKPMILLDLPHSREYFDAMFQRAGLVPEIHARSGSLEVVRTMVANGYGFSIVNVRPRNLTALDGRELATVPLAGDDKGMTVGVATLSTANRPRVLEAFIEHCRARINARNIPGMTPVG